MKSTKLHMFDFEVQFRNHYITTIQANLCFIEVQRSMVALKCEIPRWNCDTFPMFEVDVETTIRLKAGSEHVVEHVGAINNIFATFVDSCMKEAEVNPSIEMTIPIQYDNCLAEHEIWKAGTLPIDTTRVYFGCQMVVHIVIIPFLFSQFLLQKLASTQDTVHPTLHLCWLVLEQWNLNAWTFESTESLRVSFSVFQAYIWLVQLSIDEQFLETFQIHWKLGRRQHWLTIQMT